MHWSRKQYLGGVAILFLTFAVWARPDKTYTAEWDNTQDTIIGNTKIEPGTYTIQARENENTLDILQGGKVIAQLPCHWITLPKKAADTVVETDHAQIVEVEFQGKIEAIRIGNSGAGS